jgi:hypothetical protein
MLFVIGLLYGFLGGGFFGLALIDSKELKIKWHALLAEMVALGLLTYAILINQLGWLMTPPRSEMWAACLGASIAVAWYIRRNHHDAAMKVAVFSALGAGFGFAFGNFLQVLGSVSGWNFNFWNTMEYSIGFFGGMGMAYGTFTAQWPVSNEKSSRSMNAVALFFLVILVPFIVWDQTFVNDRFEFIIESGGNNATIFVIKCIAIAAIILVALVVMMQNLQPNRSVPMDINARGVRSFFILYTLLYMLLSFLVTGLYTHPLEQYLYLVNFAVILLLLPAVDGGFQVRKSRPAQWAALSLVLIGAIAFFAFIAIQTHGELPGHQIRFK